MKFAWLGCLLLSQLLVAGPQESEANINSRYTVQSIVISGDGWTTDLTSDSRDDHKISLSLRRQIASLIGTKLNPAILDEVSSKLRKEFHARAVTHRLMRGDSPDYVQVLFQVELSPTRFDVAVPKFLYRSPQGWNGAVQGTATLHNQDLTFGLVSDGDALAERYTGIVARYEDTHLGTDRLRFRFQVESYHDQWNDSTRNAAALDGASLYRSRQNFEPVVTLVLAKPLTLSVGAGFERFQDEAPISNAQAADVFLTSLEYHRHIEDAQDLDADYSLRAASRALGSDYIYTRHRWSMHYATTHGKQTVQDTLTGGVIFGRAPLFERYYLGSSTTLRGWNRFEIDPLGGNRMVHNSVEYRYGVFEVFYDTGAVWDGGQPVVARHSLGTGVRQGPLFLAVAFPLREGRIDPVFMVGMNY